MNRKHAKILGIIFLLPSFSGILLFYIIPFFHSFYYTFTQGITDVKFVGLHNFTDLIQNPTFMLAVKNTLIFMGAGIPILLAISTLLSLCVKDSLFQLLNTGYLIPHVLPISALILGWQFLLKEDGILSSVLTSLGFSPVNFLSDKYAMSIILMIYVWKNIGYISILISSSITTIPKEYYEVFYLDSKSNVKLTWYVIIPQILPMLFFSLIISIMNSFKIFKEIYVLYGAVPPKNIYMLQHFMNNNFAKLNYQRLTTAAFLLISILSILIYLFLYAQHRLTNRGGNLK